MVGAPQIMVFGTYDATRNPRVAILAEGLVERDFPLVSCVEPLRVTAERRLATLRHPVLGAGVAVQILTAWTRLLFRSTRLPKPDVVIVGYLAQFDVLLARLRYPRATIVLDHLVSLADTAQDRGVTAGTYLRILAAIDRVATAVSTVVMVDTDEHLDRLPDQVRRKGLVVPVGAPLSGFAVSPSPASPLGEPLRVVFFGHYIPLQGAPVIGDAIKELARRGRTDIQFTMIGNGQDLAQTRQRAGKAPNSEWVDRLVTREELGRLVSRHDVGLGIFGTGPKALRVVPTKVYEVAAAGLAVVTSDTAPQRRALRGAGVLIGPGDGSALADALESLADDRVRCSHLRRSALATARSSWGPARVVEPLVERLSREVTHPGHPVRGPGVSIVHGCRDAATALIRFVLR